MTRTHRAVGAAIAGAALTAVLAGCGGTPVPAPTAGTSHTGSHTMADGQRMSDHEMPGMAGTDMSGHGHGGEGGGVALWATQKSGGAIMVTDGDGNPLYRSDRDGTAPPRSACEGPCAAQWQPVTVRSGQTPELLGVKQASVGTLKRADGGTQLTLGGAPLYRHAGEAVQQPDPGRFAAQGWHIVNPTGQRVPG